MTRDKNSQKAEKKPHSTSEPVTQPQPVISAQSEYPQKARTASAQQPAQKIGSESSAQKSARGSKNTAPAGSQKTMRGGRSSLAPVLCQRMMVWRQMLLWNQIMRFSPQYTSAWGFHSSLSP